MAIHFQDPKPGLLRTTFGIKGTENLHATIIQSMELDNITSILPLRDELEATLKSINVYRDQVVLMSNDISIFYTPFTPLGMTSCAIYVPHSDDIPSIGQVDTRYDDEYTRTILPNMIEQVVIKGFLKKLELMSEAVIIDEEHQQVSVGGQIYLPADYGLPRFGLG